ncbi:MAG TPA: hypothetical protein PKE47_06200 [Verrucomicrobiota bacterium]|nr:hypothetical protein [Verrucomicrobiota bacterium]
MKLWLTLHDSTDTQAFLEYSLDLLNWAAGGILTYNPGLTEQVVSIKFPRRAPTDPAWWPQPPPMVAYRVRAMPRQREGWVTFANRLIADGINAPVTYMGNMRPGAPLGGPGLASGADFLAQLHVAVPGGGEWRVGQPVPFRTGAFAGSIAPSVVIVPMAADTDEVTITMVAWMTELGQSYHEAVNRNVGGYGSSHRLTIRPTTSLLERPATLIGLEAFTLTVPIGGVP